MRLKDKNSVEIVKWVIAVVLLSLSLIGNYVYYDVMPLARTLAIVFLLAIAAGVILLTKEGKAARAFAREARIEVRKVVWPTCKETLHTTLIVIAVTAVTSLLLWGLDGILVRVVSFITRLRL